MMGFPSYLQQNKCHAPVGQSLKPLSYLSIILEYLSQMVSSPLEIDDVDINGLGFHHTAHQLDVLMVQHTLHAKAQVRLHVRKYTGSLSLLLFQCHNFVKLNTLVLPKIVVMLISFLELSLPLRSEERRVGK